MLPGMSISVIQPLSPHLILRCRSSMPGMYLTVDLYRGECLRRVQLEEGRSPLRALENAALCPVGTSPTLKPSATLPGEDGNLSLLEKCQNPYRTYWIKVHLRTSGALAGPDT